METKYLKSIYLALFSSKISRFTLKIRSGSKVKEYNLEKTKIKGLNAFRLPGLLFIEQNPKKGTNWARLAKKGHKIMWVINTKSNKYLALIHNGLLKRLNDSA